MTKQSISKNDKAWENLFDKYKIIKEINEIGYYRITSEQINEFREARLMTKFDHKSMLPRLFKENSISILPVTRGSYIIAPFNTYHKIEANNPEIEYVKFPEYIESIDYSNINSEATAINTAYVSGILANFLEEEGLLPTIDGRMSSESFQFSIDNVIEKNLLGIQVSNSQIEIDGGYEGFESLTLIEAKNFISEDFLIRQLYYPFRLFKNKMNKPVRSVFLTYTNGIFRLREYGFSDLNLYNSIYLLKAKNYSIAQEEIELDDLIELHKNIKPKRELGDIPFPQADNFNRIINLCELLSKNNNLSKEEITTNYDFDERQTNYYTDAGRYLGLIEKVRIEKMVCYQLTHRTKRLFDMNLKERNLQYVKYILNQEVFYKVFDVTLKNFGPVDKGIVVKIMRNCGIPNINAESTYFRRASTVQGWISWILDLIR